MNEILLFRARLAAKKDELEQLNLRADNFIIAIREIIDPYTDDFTEIEIERAEAAITDLKALHTKAAELKKQIHKMEKDLNG